MDQHSSSWPDASQIYISLNLQVPKPQNGYHR